MGLRVFMSSYRGYRGVEKNMEATIQGFQFRPSL